MSIRAAIYARSSPDCPLISDEQIDRLKAVAVDRGWTVVQVFIDRPTSVRKGVDRRPGEMVLLDAIRSGTIDRVLLWSIDRVGRSLIELVGFLETCRLAGVSLWVDEQRIDTETSNGLTLFDLGSMMALHLRQARRGKILQGLAASRAMAIPCGRPRLNRTKTQKAERELAAGKSLRAVARIAGISAASVSRLKAGMAATSG